MKRVGVRELRQNLSVYLKRVKEGESLEVTEHGHPVAVLAPRRAAESAFDRMLAEGRIRPATASINDLPLPPGPVSRGGTEALMADREGEGMTIAYVEASAMVKLAIPEPETRALKDALTAHDRLVASDLAAIEVVRAARRRDGDAGATRARAALLVLNLIPIDRPIVDAATRLEPAQLRSLDAIHVATALSLSSDDVTFYSYDARTMDAARNAGIAVDSPA